ncbi:MAG: hypothetical protein KDB52_00720 [Solirubrobacterales bacterium]|nr:hypothetical protein [Solirubrobacterales bacterium]
MSLVRRENLRSGIVAALVVAGVLCVGLAGATAQADAASKPKVSASFGVAGSQVKVSGTVSKGAPRKAPPRKKWKAALEQQVGKRWVKRKTGKLSKGRKGSSKYRLAWKAPSSLKSGKFRVRLFAGKRTISSSKVKKLTFSSQVPAPKVSEVVSSSVQKLPSQGDMTLVLSGNRNFKAGEYLAAAPGDSAPDGFLLKVVSSSSSGGQTTVKVKPGSLYDAVPNGQLALATGDLQAATPQNGDAKKLLRALDTTGGASNYANVPFSKPVTCTGSGSMTLDGNFDASLAPNFDLKWSKRFGIPTGIDSARATVDASLSADASAELSAAASCTLTPITLLSPKFTFVVVVGPVPVPVTVSLPIVLEASASVSGSVTISADASVQGSIGLDYRDGDVSAVKEFSSDANLSHEVEAQANAEALIGPDIEVEAGWKIPVIGGVAAEVEINARTGLRLEYVLGNSPPGKLCVPLKLGGEVEFDTPIGDIEKGLPEYSTDIKCVEFGGSTFSIQGSIDAHGDYSWPGVNTTVGTNDASWTVDSSVPTGTDSNYYVLGHSSEWNDFYRTTSACGFNPDSWSERSSSGSQTVLSGEGNIGANPVDSTLGMARGSDGYVFHLGTSPGVENQRGSVCGFPETTASGTGWSYIAGSIGNTGAPAVYDGSGHLSGSRTGYVDHMDYEISWEFELECPSGDPPTVNWLCP